MSEYVEKSLQESLFELKFMKEVGLFTDEELGKILKKRREHEYKIRRRTKELKEYIEYIEYEKLVLELIKKRRKDMNIYSERRKIEIPIYKRIRRQFQNACSRFPQCADLWVKQIEFCLEKNETQMIGVLFTNALRLHPRNESIWIMAAQHEMQHNKSMAGARNFLQRALRQNLNSKKLYLEYFRMELLNAERMHEEANKLQMDEKEEIKIQEEEEEVDEEVKKGSIALAVFEAAVEEVPGDLSLYLDFAALCSFFPFAEWIIDEVYESISSNDYWANDREANGVLAIRPLTQLLNQLRIIKPHSIGSVDGDGEDGKDEDDDDARKAFEKLLHKFGQRLLESRRLFEEAHQKFPSEDMWQTHVELLLHACKGTPDVISRELRREAMLVCCEAFDLDAMSETMAEKWMDLMKDEEIIFSRQMALLLVKKWPSNNATWVFLFQRLCTTSIGTDDDAEGEGGADSGSEEKGVMALEVVQTLEECSRVVKQDAVLVQVWRLALNWLTINDYKGIQKIFENGLVKGSREVKRTVKELYLEWFVAKKGVEEARKLFERLFRNRPNSRELLSIYLKAELAQESVSSSHIRKAYDAAVNEMGDTCVDLWLEYIRFEASIHGSPQLVGQVYQKAIKCLNTGLENELIEKFTVLKAANFES